MTPRIENIESKTLVGMSQVMSLTANTTGQLWQRFMPRRKEIHDLAGNDLFSLQVYDQHYFDHFDPARPFTKWAAMEVKSPRVIPQGMSLFILPQGAYAVFLHHGPASAGVKTFQYIFTDWLPRSGYLLDDRPHFEWLGPKYKNEDPDSEEEFWIPIKPKS